MNRLLRLLCGKPPAVLVEAQRRRRDDWRRERTAARDTPHDKTRYVVVDVEASGLDLRADRLIAIGAVAVKGGLVDPADAFEVVLRQDQASATDNILIHGIGATQQREGLPPVEALLGFLDFLGDGALVAYHAPFDAAMIARAMEEFLDLRFRPQWIDLASILPEVYPDIHADQSALDRWLHAFAIPVLARHNALADALATAQLLQMALPRAARVGAGSPQGLAELEKARRWLRRTN